MLATWVIIAVSAAYLGLLFGIAYYGDRRALQGRSIISNGYIYALSIAVYATSWTYYGSVGSAAAGGIAWLPIYLGPMVVVTLWWVVLRKIIRICKRDRITSLADFVSSRYGKSLAGGDEVGQRSDAVPFADPDDLAQDDPPQGDHDHRPEVDRQPGDASGRRAPDAAVVRPRRGVDGYGQGVDVAVADDAAPLQGSPVAVVGDAEEEAQVSGRDSDDDPGRQHLSAPSR